MEKIQAPFEASRARAWPQVMDRLSDLQVTGRLLDLAAGNGRHSVAAALLGHDVVAVDVAGTLLSSLRSRWDQQTEGAGHIGCVEADALFLPFGRGAFDKALFAAGLHCIRGRTRRLQALSELHRVLEEGARVVITVWWRDPKRFRGPLRRTQEALDAQAREEDEGPQDDHDVPPLETGDVGLGWSHDVDEPVQRFFHLYEQGELKEDLEQAGFLDVRIEKVRQGSTWNLIADLRR